MKNRIRIIFISAILLVLSSVMSVCASADGQIYYCYGEAERFGGSAALSTFASETKKSDVSEELIGHVVEQLRDVKDAVSIYKDGYRVSVTANGELMTSAILDAPDLFYVGYSYMYSYVRSSDGESVYLYEIYPQYIMEGEQLERARERYDSMVSEIEHQAKHLNTPLEKVIFYHEYIVANFEYDLDYNNENAIYDAYNMLLEGEGVCQAYTLLMTELLDRADIKNTAISSNGLNHVWNAVSIDGAWYLLDVTWDDPLNDVEGRVYHNNLLCSTETFGHIPQSGVYDWDIVGYEYIEFSTYYDNAFWCYIQDNPIHVYDGVAYYKTASDGMRYSIVEVELSQLRESVILEKSSGQYWSLGFCGYGNRLYYVQSFERGVCIVYEYNLDTGIEREVYSLTHICSGDCYAYCYKALVRAFSDGKVLYLYMSDSAYSSDRELFSIPIDSYTTISLYDCDGDGEVTNADIVTLLRFLSGWRNESFVSRAADANSDGKINNRDLIALIKHLS